MDVMVGADDVEQPKPHPAPVTKALERLGAVPREALFVGDSPIDIQAGRAAGTHTAAALWGPFPRELLEKERPDHCVERVSDLTSLLGP